MDSPLSVTVGEACRLSGLGVTTIYKCIKEGSLDTVKIGARRLIRYSSLRELIEGPDPDFRHQARLNWQPTDPPRGRSLRKPAKPRSD